MTKQHTKILSAIVLLALYGAWAYACLHGMTNPALGGLVSVLALMAGMLWYEYFG